MRASRRELVTPHGPRTCFGGSDLFGSRFVPLGRPGFIFRLNLQNKRSRLHSQVAESSEQAENLQDNSGKVEHQSIHRGHPLPLSRIGNGCKEGAILSAQQGRASSITILLRSLAREHRVERGVVPRRLCASYLLVLRPRITRRWRASSADLPRSDANLACFPCRFHAPCLRIQHGFCVPRCRISRSSDAVRSKLLEMRCFT